MSRVQDKATTERNSRTLRELVKRPENKTCADCKRNDPRWASWNLGVFVCIRCSGIHRSMGTHISKVKSVDLDMWTPEQMANITRWGNARANAYWEAHLKQGHAPPDHKIESFIRSKYESRRWAREGPPPEDPSTLDAAGGSSAEQSLPAPPPASPPARQAAPPAAVAPVSARGVVNSQPVPQRGLLSAQQLRERPPGAASPNPPAGGSGAPKAAAPAPAPAPKPAVDDIFSLDFNAPPSTSSPSTSHAPSASKDVKTDIMSLFSKGPAPGAGVLGGGGYGQPQAGVWGATPQVQQQPQQQAGMWGAAQPSAAGGDFGTWGGAPAAAAAPPAQQAFGTWGGAPAAGPPAANVWGAPAQSQAPAGAGAGGAFGADIWGSGGFGGAPAQPAKKDDAFGDLWSSFK